VSKMLDSFGLALKQRVIASTITFRAG
jgi:hypothetical protein